MTSESIRTHIRVIGWLRTHIRVIGWLNVVLGAMSLIGGLIAFLGLSGVGFFAATQPGRHDPNAGALFGGFGLLIAGVACVSGLPSILVGAGLLRFAPWARIACIVLSILHLVNASTMGISTILGIYSLVILFQPECERLFRS